MSLEMALGQQSSLPLSFQNLPKPLEAVGEYFRAAEAQAVELSDRIKKGFLAAVQPIEVIKPIFRAAVSGAQAKMDKIVNRAKDGMLPFFQAGIGNDGENKLRRERKKSWNAGLAGRLGRVQKASPV